MSVLRRLADLSNGWVVGGGLGLRVGKLMVDGGERPSDGRAVGERAGTCGGGYDESHTVAAWIAHGCSLDHIWLQPTCGGEHHEGGGERAVTRGKGGSELHGRGGRSAD